MQTEQLNKDAARDEGKLPITLKFDNGEGGSNYGYFYEDSEGVSSEVGPSAETADAWERLKYSKGDAMAELVTRGFALVEPRKA